MAIRDYEQMLLCYTDESDEGGFFVFSGVILKGKGVLRLTRDLDGIVARASRQLGVPRTAEIHAYDVFHMKNDWAGISADDSIRIFTEVLDAVIGHSQRIVLQGVSRERLLRKQTRQNYPEVYSAERVALTYLLQRVEQIARKRTTLVIADERHDSAEMRDLFSDFKLIGTPGAYMRTNLERVIDTIHFAPSHRSRALQAADVFAFLYRRRLAGKESNPLAEAAMKELWKRAETSRKLYALGSWP
ncbi:DUF3800 domain-containing protein [Microbacterium sp. JAI119]|uniref:DUF3800 domain-containing protein n=2 Tax=unclassified Microbacterium TaxID=2609290 RepID=UPI0015CC9027|nr:DUF3800 domain-containing protein [Microbacterium sp. JAI119]NYF30067.1 hypothetical protein [Microbacterium sp. JAI119]